MRWITLVLALFANISAAYAADSDRLVVVELFTSQGCNSCPPADALLGELARQPGVLALGLHVDYWDYIGWKDPYAQRAYTERQRAYSRALNLRYIYTPQMVVNGATQGVGSDGAAVRRLIDAARQEKPGPALSVRGNGVARTLRVERGTTAEPATIWLAVFDSRHDTPVTAGENNGHRLANYNVVRALLPIGTWRGATADIPLDLSDIPSACDGAAILVQSGETGPILAAMRLDLPIR